MKKLVKLSMALTLCAVAGIASADNGDSSMNPYTGDSWAALQGHGHNLGERTPDVTVRIAKRKPSEVAPETPAVAQNRRGYDFGHRRPNAAARQEVPA